MKLLLQGIPKIKLRVALKPLADMVREIGAIALLAIVLLFISDRYCLQFFVEAGG
jgi:hypothetical protein